jgi:hypothetical protein
VEGVAVQKKVARRTAHFQPFFRAPDDDDLGGPEGAGEGHGKNAQWAHSLNQNRIPWLHAGKIESMGGGGPGAGCGNQGSQIDILFDPEKIRPLIEKKVLGVVSGQVRGRGAGSVDPVDEAMEAEGWLHLHLAEITVPW